METYLLTYVSSEGVNPISGEKFPEGRPKYRSIKEVYTLLKLGFRVEQRIDNLRLDLYLGSFADKYAEELSKVVSESDKVINKRK